MRISDWSSDVCSSDLLGDDRVGMRIPVGHGLARLDRCTILDRDGGAVRHLVTLALATAGKIGRASSRERVRQYVSISVGAVSLKNNIHLVKPSEHVDTIKHQQEMHHGAQNQSS